MKNRIFLALMFAALVAAGGCEKKTQKAEDEAGTEQQADSSEESNEAEQDEPGDEKADENAEADGIPTVSDEDLNPALLDVEETTKIGEAPQTFKAKFITSKGDFTVEFKKEWSPLGADRAYQLINANYYNGIAFFRVMEGFMAQFGIHASPKVSEVWKDATIEDEPVEQSNTRGTVTFAKRGIPNSRTTHLFINYGNNEALDAQGFAPVGEVVEGMDVVDELYNGYGGGPPTGPDQGALTDQGNPYLQKSFPQLDYIKDVLIVEKDGEPVDAERDE